MAGEVQQGSADYRALARYWTYSKFLELKIVPTKTMIEHVVTKLRRVPEREWERTFAETIKVQDLIRWQEFTTEKEFAEQRLSAKANWIALVVGILAAANAVLATSGFSLGRVASLLLQWMIAVFPYLITPLGLVVAILLFFCRGYFPRLYGSLEVLVGVVTVSATAAAVDLALPSLPPFLGGIYVIIRGMDNVAKTLDPSSRVGILFTVLFNNSKISI